MQAPICLRLLRQAPLRADSRADFNAGMSSSARIAMIAMTTSNSINVKPRGVLTLGSSGLRFPGVVRATHQRRKEQQSTKTQKQSPRLRNSNHG